MTKTATNRRAKAEAPQEDGRTRIIAAGLEVFSTLGFDGASLRQIADRAGVQHQLVVYHFKTKDALWKAVVASIFEEDQFARLDARLKLHGPAKAMRMLVREFVMFTASRPEYHRIATFEGRSESDRLRWLIDEYVRPYYELSVRCFRTAQAAGVIRAGDAGQLHYAVIGLVTTSLIFAPEYRQMTGLEPFAADELEKLVALVCDFLRLNDAESDK